MTHWNHKIIKINSDQWNWSNLFPFQKWKLCFPFLRSCFIHLNGSRRNQGFCWCNEKLAARAGVDAPLWLWWMETPLNVRAAASYCQQSARTAASSTQTHPLLHSESHYHLIIYGTYSWHKSFSSALYLTPIKKKKKLGDLIWILHCCNHAKSVSRTRRTTSLFGALSVTACAEMWLILCLGAFLPCVLF